MLTFHRLTEAAGEPVTGAYFERFWLPVVGPSALLLMRHVAAALAEEPLYSIEGAELAARLGIGGPALTRTLERLRQMGLLRRRSGSAWDARMAVRPLTEIQVRRLPEALAEQHRELTALLTS